jgi:hypothetical protein
VVKVLLALSMLFPMASPAKAPSVVTAHPQPSNIKHPREVSVIGLATWFNANRNGQTTWYTRSGITNYGAAGPGLRAIVPHFYKQNYEIIVTNLATGISVKVNVVDWCSCWGRKNNDKDDRLIDLAPGVFKSLGTPLSVGVMKIKITIVGMEDARN